MRLVKSYSSPWPILTILGFGIEKSIRDSPIRDWNHWHIVTCDWRCHSGSYRRTKEESWRRITAASSRWVGASRSRDRGQTKPFSKVWRFGNGVEGRRGLSTVELPISNRWVFNFDRSVVDSEFSLCTAELNHRRSRRIKDGVRNCMTDIACLNEWCKLFYVRNEVLIDNRAFHSQKIFEFYLPMLMLTDRLLITCKCVECCIPFLSGRFAAHDLV